MQWIPNSARKVCCSIQLKGILHKLFMERNWETQCFDVFHRFQQFWFGLDCVILIQVNWFYAEKLLASEGQRAGGAPQGVILQVKSGAPKGVLRERVASVREAGVLAVPRML